MKDICCIGHITKDKIITPKQTVYMAGGTAFYFANGIASLPNKIDFQLLTKVGNDSLKEIAALRNKHVDVVCLRSENTVFFENKYGADSNNRTQRVLAKSSPFSLEELKDAEARIFHLGSLLNDDFSADSIEYLSTKGMISIDVQGFLRTVRNERVYPTEWAKKESILSHTDILKLNEHEMQVITGSRNPRTVALQLAEYGVREVIITLGSYGSLIYSDGHFYEIPAYKPSQTVDATGCGDTYSCGYLYSRAQGASCMEAGKFAAAMCTLKLTHNGPFHDNITDIRRIIRQFG